MAISIQARQLANSTTTTRPTAETEMKRLFGVLWYNMLTDLNKTGMDENSLGVGGSNFQSMFLWNISQNDFSQYDGKLIDAAVHQVGGKSAETTAPEPVSSMVANLIASKGVQDSPIFSEALPAPNENSLSSPALITQATDFVKSIWPQITAAAKVLGVPAVAVLAQTALETGWGTAMPGHNLFGIKAVDGESGSMQPTHEVIDGVLTPQIASFRNYSNSADSISDYVSLIQTLYPDAVNQGSVAGFAHALQAGGYATDQNYAGKIEQIAQSPLMFQVLQSVDNGKLAGKGAVP